jgi:hypothetical protein
MQRFIEDMTVRRHHFFQHAWKTMSMRTILRE